MLLHSEDEILSLRTVRHVLASPRTCGDCFLSQLLHCSDGSVSVVLVVEFASLVIQDDFLLPLCPVATEELRLCLHVDKSVHTPGHAPTWLLPRQRRAPSSWSRSPSSRGWLQKRCLLPRGSMRSAESLRHPCTRKSN